jgi:hypothetical protein
MNSLIREAKTGAVLRTWAVPDYSVVFFEMKRFISKSVGEQG